MDLVYCFSFWSMAETIPTVFLVGFSQGQGIVRETSCWIRQFTEHKQYMNDNFATSWVCIYRIVSPTFTRTESLLILYTLIYPLPALTGAHSLRPHINPSNNLQKGNSEFPKVYHSDFPKS